MGRLFLIIVMLTCPVILTGCALGAGTAATAGYSLSARTADDLSAAARKSIVDEAIQKAKDYCDQKQTEAIQKAKEYCDQGLEKKK